MRDTKRSGILRIAAGIMGLMMLAAVLFCAFFIASEADHHCSGEDCLICALIHQCENTLRGAGGAAVKPAFILPVIIVLLAAAILTAAASLDTPVLRKVRLNN